MKVLLFIFTFLASANSFAKHPSEVEDCLRTIERYSYTDADAAAIACNTYEKRVLQCGFSIARVSLAKFDQAVVIAQ